ncbi:MAG: serine hydroxymethyltransferase [Candidatus Caenarcaniphilales bacterium]|nr:serine hydroxymethyltransferase [Candidatus Caenarcaniphilales bacterium]
MANFDLNNELKDSDKEVYDLIAKEANRQSENIELIASENFTSRAVMEVMGSCLTNKYAEGYPGKRYYNGCEFHDELETLAIERAKKLFGAKFANVQPHSGANANIAAFMAMMQPGDAFLGMSLKEGGHLTHGSPVNFSGKFYKVYEYGVNDEGLLDYDEIARIAQESKPKVLIAGASAYPRTIDFAKFREIADSVGAFLMVDMAHIAGLVAAGVHPSPVPFADVVTTTTHKTLAGPRGGLILTNNEDLAKKLNSAVFPGSQGGPLMHTIAAKAVCFAEAMTDDFKAYQEQVVKNTKALAESLRNGGIDLVSNGSDNHLVLLDLIKDNITGKDLANLLDEYKITVNKNGVPKDPQSPFVTSGIRIGTPAMTRRGFKEKEFEILGNIISRFIKSMAANELALDEDTENFVKSEVESLTKSLEYYKEPVYS